MELSWGKPRLFCKDLDESGSKWKELPTPVEDSTELQPTKGAAVEAPIEGGQNEDMFYKASKYATIFNIRKKKNRENPFPHKDGRVSHKYAFILMPEDPTNLGYYVEKNTVGVDDTFKSGEGAVWAIQMDALAPTSGNTIKWGTVTLGKTSDETSKDTIAFTESENHMAEGQTTATTVAASEVELLS